MTNTTIRITGDGIEIAGTVTINDVFGIMQQMAEGVARDRGDGENVIKWEHSTLAQYVSDLSTMLAEEIIES